MHGSCAQSHCAERDFIFETVYTTLQASQKSTLTSYPLLISGVFILHPPQGSKVEMIIGGKLIAQERGWGYDELAFAKLFRCQTDPFNGFLN